jgi:phage terminase small subunit
VPRPRSPNRDKAFEIFKEHNGNISNKEIARILNEKLVNINSWRTQDKWAKRLNKTGAPYGNKNAVGNSGGRAPKGNYNSFKYGKYTARIPFAVKTIMEELDIEDPLEKLWRSICLQEARIIHMQDIMHVKDRNDLTKDIKKLTQGNNPSIEFEIQFAWDKEANLINTLSKAHATLTRMIKEYEELLHANRDTATEIQRLRVEKLKADIAKDAW